MSGQEMQAASGSLSVASSGNAQSIRRRVSTGSSPDANPKRRKVDQSDNLICPITLELPIDPVVAQDGHTYERRAIEKHFSACERRGVNCTSPMTNEPIGRELRPNLQTTSMIESLIESGSITGTRARQWKENKGKPAFLLDAEDGDVKAMRQVGHDYFHGSNGLSRNHKLAFKWFNLASKGGSVPAMASLGRMYHKGQGVEQNSALGMFYTTSAAEKGSNQAAWLLGKMFHEGRYGIPKDREQAIYWLKKTVGPGAKWKTLTDTAVKKAKELFAELEGESRNESDDETQWGSLNLPLPDNVESLGRPVSTINGPEDNPTRREVDPSDNLICPITCELPIDPVVAQDGHTYERRAIEKYFQNFAFCQSRLSPVTNEMIGGELRPAPRIKSLIESLIESGSITGARARQWKENKRKPDIVWDAEGGNVWAMNQVGSSYYYGRNGFKRNYKAAFKLFDQALFKKGSVPAMSLLGRMYHKGQGVEQNDALGMMYSVLAANGGCNFAAWRLGYMFLAGRYGVPKDREQAIYWLKKAVDPAAKYKTLPGTSMQKAKDLLAELEGESQDESDDENGSGSESGDESGDAT